jgi:hypothetical protein
MKLLKLLQERIGKMLEQIGIGNDFLNRTPIAQQLRERMKLHQTKKFFHKKGNGHQTEEEAHRMGENICQKYI